MKHFGKNRFISFFALLLVLTLALSMNSVFAADTAATGTAGFERVGFSGFGTESGTKSRTETGKFCILGKPNHPGSSKKPGLGFGQQ